MFMEDISDFRKEYFQDHPVYHDPNMGFYKAQGNRYLSYLALMWPSVKEAIQRADSKGIKGNTRGDGHYLGGVLVVQKGGILFEHREEFFGNQVTGDVIRTSMSAVERIGSANKDSF